MATSQQEREFGAEFLENILEYIKENFAPDDVFDEQTLRDHVQSNAKPGDVFDESELEEWALSNDFVKEE